MHIKYWAGLTKHRNQMFIYVTNLFKLLTLQAYFLITIDFSKVIRKLLKEVTYILLGLLNLIKERKEAISKKCATLNSSIDLRQI